MHVKVRLKSEHTSSLSISISSSLACRTEEWARRASLAWIEAKNIRHRHFCRCVCMCLCACVWACVNIHMWDLWLLDFTEERQRLCLQAVQGTVLSHVQSFLLERAVHASQLKHEALLLLQLQVKHTARAVVRSTRDSPRWAASTCVMLTSASFSLRVLCSSDSLSRSCSRSLRRRSLSSSEALSCISMCDSRSSKTLFYKGSLKILQGSIAKLLNCWLEAFTS